MIVVRTIFQAKFGRGGELAAHMAANNSRVQVEMCDEVGGQRRWRVLTDLSGTFDTVVMEVVVGSLAEWEQARAVLFQLPAFQQSMAKSQELILSGHNETWTVEAEGWAPISLQTHANCTGPADVEELVILVK